MRRTGVAVPALAILLAAVGAVVALALPMYTCKRWNHLEFYQGPGGPHQLYLRGGLPSA
jgi:hypothetical protein